MLRMLMILFSIMTFIWIISNMKDKAEVVAWEPPLPQEYRIINQANKDLVTDIDDRRVTLATLKSPIWNTIDQNKVALIKEIIKALPLYADKPELFIVINLLYKSEIPKYREHASLVTETDINKKEDQRIIDMLKNKDQQLFRNILFYLKPSGDKAKEICDAYNYSNCDPYINVLINLGTVYNIQEDYTDALPYLETVVDHIDCFKNEKLISPEQEFHTQLGLSYLGLKQFDAAVHELEASKPKKLSFSTQVSGWKSELAVALQKAGYIEAAKEYWEAEVAFWEVDITKNTENKNRLYIHRKLKKKAEILLSELD